jgi:hypothetical protein
MATKQQNGSEYLALAHVNLPVKQTYEAYMRAGVRCYCIYSLVPQRYKS